MGWKRFTNTGMPECTLPEKGSMCVETYFVTSYILPGQGKFSRGVKTQPSPTTYSGIPGIRENTAGIAKQKRF
jgi:hypothetical protein